MLEIRVRASRTSLQGTASIDQWLIAALTTSRFSPVLMTRIRLGVVVAASFQELNRNFSKLRCFAHLGREESTTAPVPGGTADQTLTTRRKEAHPVNAVALTGSFLSLEPD